MPEHEPQVLLEDFDRGVLTLTLNRPDRLNALNEALLDALTARVTAAASDPTVRVIVLAGAGRAFCAGADVRDGVAAGLSREERVAQLRGRAEVARLLHEMPKVTIASVQGSAAGGGLALALACDFRVGCETTKFASAYLGVGLSGDFGGSWFLSRLVGPTRAREIYMLGETVRAEEAQRLGLLSRMVAADELAQATRDFAHRFADGPGAALGRMKQNFNLAQRAGLAELLEAEAERHIACLYTADHKEAVRAFVEKRSPSFTGT